MKIQRKKRLNKVKIHHNKKLLYIILVLVIVLIGIIYLIMKVQDSFIKTPKVLECESDSDCIPNSCCHSSSCTNINNAPDCGGIFCSQECVKNTLDCGQGSCICNQGKCEVKLK